jgi:asparagine synthase (glutamine-hydrolysing)
VNPSAAGFLAVSGDTGPDLTAAAAALGGEPQGGVVAAGLTPVELPDGSRVTTLAVGPRRHEQDLTPAAIAAALTDLGARAELLPPFAAAVWSGDQVTAVVDRLGFRHLYSRQGDGWAALSTSARALAALEPAGLDRTAMAAQGLLGWQLGDRTPFEGVSVVPAGSSVALGSGQLSVSEAPADDDRPPLGLDDAVDAAADLLRAHLGAFLDDHPDAVLQLTGGQDSRVLLGAVPVARRRDLRVMTLSVPGSPDLEIATALARRYGMTHDVVDLSGLEDCEPAAAHALAVDAARRLECSADPLAWAAVAWAEAKLEPRPRLAGLGGEVTRGFYYLGPARAVPVTEKRVRRLADWRLFPNEAVPADVLDPAYVDWARERTVRELTTIFRSYGPDWLTATDRFYLRQRMHRWAGVLASATCLDRLVVNPMLDDRFLDLAARLRPRDKQGSRFLARLSCRLDEELSAIPLDGRPAPAVYAYPSARNRAALAAMTGRKITGKVRQRLRRDRRPPVGGEVLAAKVAEYYREQPAALDAVAGLGIFRADWLAAVAAGSAGLAPAAAAMLVNLEVATAPVGKAVSSPG